VAVGGGVAEAAGADADVDSVSDGAAGGAAPASGDAGAAPKRDAGIRAGRVHSCTSWVGGNQDTGPLDSWQINTHPASEFLEADGQLNYDGME
jgi:hypothetical protein